MSTEPALVLLVRGIDAFKRLFNLIGTPKIRKFNEPFKPIDLDKIVSPRPELAYTYANLFFSSDDLFEDNHSRPLISYIPAAMYRIPVNKSTQ